LAARLKREDEMKKDSTNKAEIFLFGLLVGFLVPLEVFCAYLAFETIGEIVSTLYFLAAGLNLLFILLAFRKRTLAALGVVLLATAIIPYQLYLGNRLVRVQAEASRIVTYVYAERIDTGEYPSSLANYEFHDPGVKRFIQSYRVEDDAGAFALFFRVGTENTSHYYLSQTGWGYYPD
jgi:hypothetical protein